MPYGDETMMAGAILKLMQKAVADGKALREKQTPPEDIEKIMRDRGFSAHVAKRIRREIMGQPLTDEISTADTVKIEDLKTNTVRLTLRKDAGVDLYDIVRYRAKDYQVQKMSKVGENFVVLLKEFARV
ncbi:MAG: hypothetical protein A3G34_04465 [Candidatus Lindowbacteria bacterium RIFCSPLOWO2_12_FULL_62_27]|nr:MAG: hypothetical protein A3I06_04230 [Candidatus Lindowbacteria bacterium RIFCSPLOWO2_02_FULL_62_12]OGH57416.1 MAG: hypothetical protein A3G34_04465 [Candidatus Lindowbacteria bacterium RIFCSPLOWO2_12_FULL_62_27]